MAAAIIKSVAACLYGGGGGGNISAITSARSGIGAVRSAAYQRHDGQQQAACIARD